MTRPIAPHDAMKVSVIIPILNAGPYLPELIPVLRAQRPEPPAEILILDSGSTDRSLEIAAGYDDVRVVRIDDFSHGRTRNRGVREARGDVVVFLSQDALPVNEQWLARLLDPMADPNVAASYSRQIPRDDANPMERFFLQDRFPAGDRIRRQGGGPDSLSLVRVFFSNVSAAIRRAALLKFPFDEQLIMSEDQQVSRDLMAAGFTVVYEPESVVYHSHNYTLTICFRRYFDSVYSLTKIFPAHGFGTSGMMGAGYLWREVRFILRHHPLWFPYYLAYTVAKVAGTLAGHCAERMPRTLARACSLHPYYWRED